VRFKHYKNSNSLGNKYVFGLNVYKNNRGWNADLIIGKRVFILYWGEK